MWFYETLHEDIKLGFKGKQICSKKTAYQSCKIYETPRFGQMLILDGAIQTTEKDEFIYHEMLTHPLLLTHPKPEKVLIIGAGDGGILREVLKHRVKEVTLVEIDEEVINFSKKHLPSLNNGSFNDRRAKVIIGNGAKYIQETKEKFDIVIIDSPDPIGPAKILFSKGFYKNVFSILNNNGLMIRQTGSTILQLDILKKNHQILKSIFPYITIQIAAIPTYIVGFFSFIIASKSINLQKQSYQTISKRYSNLNLNTKYYNPDIHFASTKLPNYIGGAIK